MINVFVLAADAYRMIDVLRDYADILDSEAYVVSDSLGIIARRAAERIESGKRSGGLIEVERFDLDAAHSATIGVMLARRERAEGLRAEAERLEDEANRLERMLDNVFTA